MEMGIIVKDHWLEKPESKGGAVDVLAERGVNVLANDRKTSTAG
jgi:hypothetical protein